VREATAFRELDVVDVDGAAAPVHPVNRTVAASVTATRRPGDGTDGRERWLMDLMVRSWHDVPVTTGIGRRVGAAFR